jgi:hypothetical protein
MAIARAVSVCCVTAVMGIAGSASTPAWAQAAHRCAPAAREQAGKLLAFHVGGDDRIEIDTTVRTLLPMRNPANRLQRFDVLEVRGRIYKGQYRLRLIYARIPNDCVLMGQEVMEFASLCTPTVWLGSGTTACDACVARAAWRCGAPRPALRRRHEPLQLLDPVLHDDDARRRSRPSDSVLSYHQEPLAVW